MPAPRLWPGKPYPLGATWDGEGTNFALFSEHATKVGLHLFDGPEATEPKEVLPLAERTAFVWHGYVHGVKPKQLYAYRVHGPWEPEKGHRFNPAKLLLDPYAKAITGTVRWDDALFGYVVGDTDLKRDDRDSCPFMPKCVVIDPAFDWGDDRSPSRYLFQSVIYETHVKGITARHPDADESARGTFAGLASPPIVKHLERLGVTAAELLPVQQHVDERELVEKGLSDYWGYNTIGFFAPDCRYSSAGCLGEQVREFKRMVKTLHAAGIEVILDVVYNHTAEGNHLGPSLCFRGIDNFSYYHLDGKNQSRYEDFSGCGNSLRMAHPRVLQLIMDSLRYWVLEMRVDGFRFDLAAALARGFHVVDKLSAFFDLIQQDPVLSRVKIIAEPWDLGDGGYQVGNFPPRWAEWNGKYRDTVRRFWRGDESQVAELAYRLSGSSDLYQDDGRKPFASVNFVTCHDGFTLSDLVSYNEKRNKANEEENRDGADENMSWNCGAEGPSDDPAVGELRLRQEMNFLATLLLSQGVPMLLGGDEIGRTQGGNNNAYCQDNETSWYDWELDEAKRRLLDFTCKVIRLRRQHPVFRRRYFFQGRRLLGSEVKDITWLRPDGREMDGEAWQKSFVRTIGVLLAGDAIDEPNEMGERVVDDTFLMLINAHTDEVRFDLPPATKPWRLILYTAAGNPLPQVGSVAAGEPFRLKAHSFALFSRRNRLKGRR